MRTTILLATAALLASTSYAQLKKCALECTGDTSHGLGGCGNDPACICGKKGLLEQLACCVSVTCKTEEEKEDTFKFAKVICDKAGVTDIPTAATCAPGVPSTPLGGATATDSATATDASATATATSTATGSVSVTPSANTATSNTATLSTSAKATTTSGSAAAAAARNTQAAFYGLGAMAFGALAAL